MQTSPDLGQDALWRQRFRLPHLYAMQIARRAPERGLFISDLSGSDQLYAWDIASGTFTALTDRPTSVWGYLSADGRSIYYLDDDQGDEIGHLVRVPFEGGPAQDITPDMPPYSVPFESNIFGLSTSHSGRMLGYTVSLPEGFSLYCVEQAAAGTPGAARLLHTSEKLVVGPLLSYDGEIALLAATGRGEGMQYGLLAFDTADGRQIGELYEDGSIEPVLFSPVAGDMRLLATSNRSGFKRPFLWHPRTHERVELALGNLEGEFLVLDWSADGRRLLLSQFVQARPSFYLYDLERQELRQLEAPSGVYHRVRFRPDGELFAVWTSSTQSACIVALDGETGARKRTVLSMGETPPSRPFTSVTFPSSDGQLIQAWLALPEGEGPFPTILDTHGGPDGVMVDYFDPLAQAWLDHGFAYISVNYRGSITFGRAFQEQIWGDVGHWEIEDMVAAYDYLVKNGIARPDQVLLTGWSYGGYLTLLALGKRPELWAGGMAGIAYADCAIAYEDEADTLKAYDVTLYKGTPQEQPELYRRASPITYAEQVRAPVLIIQGRNDTRCPPRSIEIYEAKMKELGKPIEVHWFDAGHGSGNVELQIEHQALMLAFAFRILFP